MAFYSHSALVQRTIIRLRQVAGPSTQLYAEDAIAMLIEETYELVRSRRWWDNLTKWETRQLDGTTGKCTAQFIGTREGFRDVDRVCYGSNSTPLPLLSSNINPYRLTGTSPRYVEPLHSADDVQGWAPTGQNLFRIWPLTSVTTVAQPLRIHIREDPASLFTNTAVVVPFDASCLINGAAAKYAADDGTNPATVTMLQQAFENRLQQLEQQHDSAKLILDPRMNDPMLLNEWAEDR
jgi:hypothetical protein